MDAPDLNSMIDHCTFAKYRTTLVGGSRSLQYNILCNGADNSIIYI